MDLGLSGRVAIVTGGGSGIGRAIAVALAREGARVMVTGRRADSVQATVDLILGQGGQAAALSVDVTSASQVSEMVETCVAGFGGVDILVYTPDEFAVMQQNGNAFAEMITEEARLIYDRQAKN